MASGSIFRNSAVERLSTPDRLDQPLRITGPLGWTAVLALSALVLVGVIASIVLSVPVKVAGDGIVITPAGVLQVPADEPGRVARLLVAPGAHVRVGQPVAALDQPELALQLRQARADQRDLADQRARVLRYQGETERAHDDTDAGARADLESRAAMIEDRLKDLRDRQTALEGLLARQIVTKERVLDNRLEIGRESEQLADARRQIRALSTGRTMTEIGAGRERLDLDLRLAAATRRGDALAERLREAGQVLSPYAGVVAEVRRNAGEMVGAGQALMTLLPDDARDTRAAQDGLVAVIYVPGAEGKKVLPGMRVEVSPSTFRREEFGFILGRVKSVAAIPATQEGMMRMLQNGRLVGELSQGGAPFQVEVALERDPSTATGYRWSTSKGPDATISPGTLAHAQVWVRRYRPIEFIVPALRRWFGDER